MSMQGNARSFAVFLSIDRRRVRIKKHPKKSCATDPLNEGLLANQQPEVLTFFQRFAETAQKKPGTFPFVRNEQKIYFDRCIKTGFGSNYPMRGFDRIFENLSQTHLLNHQTAFSIDFIGLSATAW